MTSAAESNLQKLSAREDVTVSTREKVGYGLGDFGGNIAFGAMATFVTYFYTDVAGLAAGVMGTVMLASRLLDGVVDLGMGAIVDRTRSRHGKARPWLLYMGIPFSVSLVILFAVPDVGSTGKLVYAIITYNLLMILFTGVIIPYGTLNTLITGDQKERAAINVIRMFFAMVGLIIVNVITMPMVGAFGNDQRAWIITFTIFAVFVTVLFLVTFKSTHERAGSANLVAPAAKPSLGASLRSLVRNKYWVMAVCALILFSIGEATFQGATVYFAKYQLHSTAMVSVLSFLILVPGAIAILFATPLYKRFGKTRIMIIGCAVYLAGSLVLMIDPTNMVLVSCGTIVRGIGRVGVFGAIWAMLPDTMEYGEWKTGVRNEGLIYSGGSTGQKSGYGLGVGLVGWVLGWAGYVGDRAVQPDAALTAINILFIYIPAATFGALIVLLLFHKLDKRYDGIVAELRQRRTNDDDG